MNIKSKQDYVNKIINAFGTNFLKEFAIIDVVKDTWDRCLKIKHLKCNREFEISLKYFLKTKSCKCCSKENFDKQMKILNLSNFEEFKHKFIVKISEKEFNNFGWGKFKYLGANKKSSVLHIKCGKYFEAAPSTLLKGHGCPYCKLSKGENIIKNCLESKFANIKFVQQYPIYDLPHKTKPLSFDFYIPSLNIAIEFQGSQHYIKNKFLGGDKEFKESNFRDKLKNSYCKDSGIKLLEIPYWEKDNIEKILKDNISNVKSS